MSSFFFSSLLSLRRSFFLLSASSKIPTPIPYYLILVPTFSSSVSILDAPLQTPQSSGVQGSLSLSNPLLSLSVQLVSPLSYSVPLLFSLPQLELTTQPTRLNSPNSLSRPPEIDKRRSSVQSQIRAEIADGVV